MVTAGSAVQCDTNRFNDGRPMACSDPFAQDIVKYFRSVNFGKHIISRFALVQTDAMGISIGPIIMRMFKPIIMCSSPFPRQIQSVRRGEDALPALTRQ